MHGCEKPTHCLRDMLIISTYIGVPNKLIFEVHNNSSMVVTEGILQFASSCKTHTHYTLIIFNHHSLLNYRRNCSNAMAEHL